MNATPTRTLLRTAILASAVATLLAGSASAQGKPAVRHIAIDAKAPTTPRDRFYDLSVGSDYPGTLLRDDSLGQMKTAHDELGFRYVRFHAIFHDVLGTYRVVDGKPVYDWTKIDQLYDGMLKMGVKPFIELGFTPDVMKTSEQTIFYWKGNTSHPASQAVGRADRRFRATLPSALWHRSRGAQVVFRVLERAQPRRLLGKGRPEGLFRAVRHTDVANASRSDRSPP
jgi:hypothetical protein